MSFLGQYNYTVNAGETWQPVLRWATSAIISKPITGITKSSPATITATAHGAPDGWPVAVVSAGGMTQINATKFPPAGPDWKQATVLDVNTVALNKVNSGDWTPYTLGGFLVYYTPGDLSTIPTAVFSVYDNPQHTGTPLLTLAIGANLVLNNVTKTITVTVQTAGLAWTTGYYELLITNNSAPAVTLELINGVITIAP
jgi:hypothetical protein